MSIRLRGVLEHTFGGALCMRGFALISDLANLSEARYNDYQRPLDIERAEEISDYLVEGHYRFFPEIILGLQLDDPDAIVSIIDGVSTTFPKEKIKFMRYPTDYNNYKKSDKYNSPLLRRMSLTFPDGIKILSRIDGNHRLSSLDVMKEKYQTAMDDKNSEKKQFYEERYDKISKYYVPYCIIIQHKSEEAERHEIAYFHLINSKSKKLTSEESLKSIFNEGLFSDEEIKELLGEEIGIDAKALSETISLRKNQYFSIDQILIYYEKSFCLRLLKILRDNEIDYKTVENIVKNIRVIDAMYFENDFNNKSCEILLAFIYYRIKNIKQFQYFKEWIFNTHLSQIEGVKAQSIIAIFDKIQEKRIYKIFVAIPYWSHEEVNEYNLLFKEILRGIEQKEKVELELIPIMRFKGKSQRIDRRLLDSIDECDIFIANITGCNENVIFEVGYAEGKDKPMIIIKEENDDSLVPFDMDKLQWIPYKKEVYYSKIKSIISNNLREILHKEFHIEG